MHQRVNRQVRLKSRPSGIPQAEHFEIVEAPVPDPSDGQVLVRNIYLSVDPAMRGWVSAVANYSEPVALGAIMRSGAVGRVEESRSADFHAGDCVLGMFGWQDFAVVAAEAIERKVDGSGLPISTSLGVLGLNGLTAYFALLEVGQPRAGETVVVSTAAGAVGSCVGQIAKIKGCRTVGIAGGPDKVRMCREDFRYDSAVDYTRLTISRQHSMSPAQKALTSTSTTRPAQSAIPSCDVSMSEHGWSSAARHPSRAGTRHHRDRGSNVIFSSNARECRVFSSLTMFSAVPRHCGNLRAGCATDRSAIERTLDGIEQARVRSQGCTAARISASV
jgi:hypothetical protein